MSTNGEKIRQYILEHVEHEPKTIVRATADKFGISRQAVNRHLRKLIADKLVASEGTTSGRSYWLVPAVTWRKQFELAPSISEDAVWHEVARQFEPLPDNVLRIWQYGFTEMVNNVIDHSGGQTVTVSLEQTAADTEIAILDDGVGIFKKIKEALNLLDERQAVVELAKGKFTTDPARHTGEGIFFTSRSFDEFGILSGDVYFAHQFKKKEDWILGGERSHSTPGTLVLMRLGNRTSRTLKSIFDEFSSGDDYGFTKTVVPVALAQYGDDHLVSRSQAKRLLARFDRFETVILDFDNVASIGQSFADEIFRVFAKEHRAVRLVVLRANPEVAAMIARARSAAGAP